MKKPLIFTLLLVMLSGIFYETKAESYTFKFNESDFSLELSDTNSFDIISTKIPIIYPDESQPCIPNVIKRIAIGNNDSISDFSVDYNKRLIKEGIKLNNAPQALPTNIPLEKFPVNNKGYISKIYPDSNCILSGNYHFAGFNVMNFLACPFQYDANTGNLYFIDSIRVDITIESTGRQMAPARNVREEQIDMLRSFIENKEVVDNMPALMSANSMSDAEIIDYVIITSNSLKNAFQPLATWKQKKGVRTKIITIEEITSKYPSSELTLAMKIKTYLIDLYNENFLRFVLLGGDVQIVPTQPCYVDSYKPDPYNQKPGITIVATDIPADVYYSTLGNVNWDTNNDGKFGEPKQDNIDIVPILYVTRAPVRNISEAQIFVDRIIEYEQSPKITYELLHAGTILDQRITGEQISDMIFREVVVNKLILGRKKIFDPDSTSNIKFSSTNFCTELSKGYLCTEVFSHASYNEMRDEFGSKILFTREQASKISNSGHTIFTTMACSTNAFDQTESTYKSDPCISEALIRNPHSGIVAYLGASRFGWYDATLTISLSPGYEYDFYNRLLHDAEKPTTKHFGALVNFIKHSFMNAADYLENGQYCRYRWLHYAINGIGDPETPLFNCYPKSNTIAKVNPTFTEQIKVDTGFDDTRVCVSSKNDDSFYETYIGKEFTFETGPGTFDVWITKQNYIPKHFEVTVRKINLKDPIDGEFEILQPQIISITPNPASTTTTIKYKKLRTASKLIISLTNSETGEVHNYDTNDNQSEMTIDISSLKKGIYIVKLIEDGFTSTKFERLIKQ